MKKDGEKPLANPWVVLREEFDDWAVLFDPDSGTGLGLNPTGVYVWKLLDGEHSIDDLLKALRRDAKDMPQEAAEDLYAFVAELTARGLTGYEGEQVHEYGGRIAPWPTSVSDSEPADEKEKPNGLASPERFVYAKPCLVSFSEYKEAQGKCTSVGHGDTHQCNSGSMAQGQCTNGFGAAPTCSTGYGT